MRYGHGPEALIESRISKTNSILVQFNKVAEKKKNSLNFSDPRLNISEFYRQTPRETATDAVPIFRNILERFAPVFFIAFFLYKLSTTAKYVGKKQNNTFLCNSSSVILQV